MSPDELALNLLLAGDGPGTQAWQDLTDACQDRYTCPRCDIKDVVLTNGSESVCCQHCGNHFEPV